MSQLFGMDVEGEQEFAMMSFFKGSTVSVQSFAKSGNQHPLRPSNIADCQALHKRCTLVFSLISGAPTTVNLEVSPLFPGEEQPMLHIAPALGSKLVDSDTFTLVNTGDYHEIEFVPKYRKHHRSHRPHYNVVISIDGEPAFQWNTVVHHPGYAKQSADDGQGPVELHLESGPDVDGINFGLFPFEDRELGTHQPSLTPEQVQNLSASFLDDSEHELRNYELSPVEYKESPGDERKYCPREQPSEPFFRATSSALLPKQHAGSAVDFAPMPPTSAGAGVSFALDASWAEQYPGDGSVHSWAELLDSNARVDFNW